ncbi:hypothetical protein BT96DRAFT_914406 [Gymnopus androsaceus JB14]|uniref:Uncharacterized protein n=1 Tax=Gymnopus androsaceus JB14 TaxID=1447944 RepID=A0A6A4IB10_9AGAR|nr:hypothetical protein BT96DRAFT_914406 [Gymnopus androsaceus JB14]
MVTDTKSVWTEVLTSNLIARRWKADNGIDPFVANSVGSAEFEIVESNYSDLAFKIEHGTFKWTWETCFLGHRYSSEIISKHLVLPLISFSHLSLSAGSPVGEMSDSDLEKAIDRMGRVSRKSIDAHVKSAFSKPRLATSIQRVSAVFNFIQELPPISSTQEVPDLQNPSPPSPKIPIRAPTPTKPRPISPYIDESNFEKTPPNPSSPSSSPFTSRKPSVSSPKPVLAEDSATEDSDDNEPAANIKSPVTVAAASASSNMRSSPPEPSKSRSPAPVQSKSRSKAPSSETDSPPPRPAAKKKKVESSSSEDSEEERRKRIARLKSGTGTGGRGGGSVRQPLKRGAKRF